MPVIDFEIGEFGKRLGIDGLSLNDRSAAGLVIAAGYAPTGIALGTLTLERLESPSGVGEPELLVVLSRTIEPSESARYGALLSRIHWRRHPAAALCAGLFRNELILSTRIPQRRVTASALENTLRLLSAELSAV